MFKRIFGVITLIAGITGVYYDSCSAVQAALLISSGAYLLKLDADERQIEHNNKVLGILTDKNIPEIEFHEKNIDADRQRFLLEKYEKARSDYLELLNAKTKTRDKALHSQLLKMEQIAGRLLVYLSENPERISAATKFIDYYQDRALVLVNRYFELTMTGLNTAEVKERREKVLKAIYLMDEAYEAEFHKVLSNDFLDIDAEIEVIEGNMKVEGITENNNRNISTENISLKDAPPNLKLSTSQRMANIKRLESYNKDLPILYDKSDVVTSKIIQGVLGVLLGSFGAHKFYQGKNFQGFVYCLFFFTLIPGFVGFIEGIRYLVMRTDDYYLEYYSKFKK